MNRKAERLSALPTTSVVIWRRIPVDPMALVNGFPAGMTSAEPAGSPTTRIVVSRREEARPVAAWERTAYRRETHTTSRTAAGRGCASLNLATTTVVYLGSAASDHAKEGSSLHHSMNLRRA